MRGLEFVCALTSESPGERPISGHRCAARVRDVEGLTSVRRPPERTVS